MLDEALDSRRLQSSGTFQNCLVRKLDDIIIPVFSELIQFMDTCSNLNLLHQNEHTAIEHFWLEMFGCRELTHNLINYCATDTSRVPVVGGKPLEFKCKLPFSWLITEVVESFSDLILGELLLHACALPLIS